MGTKKSINEKIQENELKITQLKNQQKSLLQKQKQNERKNRTHRLIQNGALAEQYLNCEDMESQEFELLLRKIVCIHSVKDIIFKRENKQTN